MRIPFLSPPSKSLRYFVFFSSLDIARRVLVLALILGQILSLLLCAGGISSAALEKFQGITAPTTQLFLSYLLLAFVFGTVLACKEGFLHTLWQQWWKYAILGLIDAEANYLVVLAYKYTSFTSIQVISCTF